MATLKVPYLNLSGPDGAQVRRNFEDIQKFFKSATLNENTGVITWAGAASGGPSAVLVPWTIGYSTPHGTLFGSLDISQRGAPTAGNYVLLASSSDTFLNAPTGGRVRLRINNTEVMNFYKSGTSDIAEFTTYGGGWYMHDTSWVRTVNDKSIWAGAGTIGTNGKISIGANGVVQSESMHIQGSNCGISMTSRNTGNRWVIYPDGSGIHFWENGERALVEDADGAGRFQTGLGHHGAAIIGPWTGGGNYMAVGSLVGAQNNAGYYVLLSGGTVDADAYRAPSWTNGAMQYRLANNGATFGSWGVNNRTMGVVVTLDMALPALGGGNTMNLQAGGSWQVGYISSSAKVKRNVRSLRETPDPDSGHQSPVFKMRPARFNWKQASRDRHGHWKNDGVANADEINAKYPNGVVGLIAEEVAEIAPDAALHRTPVPAEPWDREKHGLPWTDPDTGKAVTHTTEWEGGIVGIDNDRLIAYLIDAVQYLKEEIDRLRTKAVGLGPLDRNPIR